MRPYRIVDEAFDDDEDERPRVISISGGSRSRGSGLAGAPDRRPWTPRGGEPPAAARRRADPSPMLSEPGLTRTHRWMIAGFIIVCVGMVLGMLMVRVWDEASQAVAALPPEGSAQAARPAAAAPAPATPAAVAEPQAPAQPAAGAVTTEIRVLQPNYTVAPGDSLGIIARKHGTSVDALASINNLENRNSLSVGQKLIIP
jgi:hypothetical protein